MQVLPADRVVNVTHTRADSFTTAQGFGTPLFITDDTSGPLDATTLTKAYSSIDEVAVDYAPGTEPYKMALAAFSQKIAPIQIKLGFRPAASASAADIQTDLQAIKDFDDDWYRVAFDANIRGVTALEDGAIAWFQTQFKELFLTSNDPLAETLADTTTVAARNKDQGYDRTVVFYSEDATEYPCAVAAAIASTRNFDDADTAYTLKFKEGVGLTALNKGSAVVQILTGFVPELGLDTTQGHLMNAYVNVAGQVMFVEGQNIDGSFEDEVAAGDWIVARTQERVLSLFKNNARVPYTNVGFQMVASCAQEIMERARNAGLIDDYIDENGDLNPGYTLIVPRVENVPAAQRRQRIMPAMQVRYRNSGAIHYTTINFTQVF